MIVNIDMLGVVKQVLIIGISAAIGAAVFAYSRPALKIDKVRIVYVAQNEILELERQRVKTYPLAERQLFFGEVDKAVMMAIEIPRSYSNDVTKVVYSTEAVKGVGVRSISKEVHERIIDRLSCGSPKPSIPTEK